MIIVFILFVAILLSYTVAVSLKSYSIPGSISASFYALEHKWWFRFTMWLSPVLLFISTVDVATPNSQFALWLAMVGMVSVGCSPNYKEDEWERMIHMAGASMTLGFSQLWVAMNVPMVLCLWSLYVIYTLLYTFLKHKGSSLKYRFLKSKPMFWVEITAIGTVICAGSILLTKNL